MKLEQEAWHKIKKYTIIILSLICIGFFVLYMINRNEATNIELEYLDKIKKEKIILRDSLTLELKKNTKDIRDSISSILKQNPEVKYIPYEKTRYKDRNVDSAIYVLRRARHNIQLRNQ